MNICNKTLENTNQLTNLKLVELQLLTPGRTTSTALAFHNAPQKHGGSKIGKKKKILMIVVDPSIF